jgi:hypothetical protein
MVIRDRKADSDKRWALSSFDQATVLVKFTHTCNVGTRLRIQVSPQPPATESSTALHSTSIPRKATLSSLMVEACRCSIKSLRVTVRAAAFLCMRRWKRRLPWSLFDWYCVLQRLFPCMHACVWAYPRLLFLLLYSAQIALGSQGTPGVLGSRHGASQPCFWMPCCSLLSPWLVQCSMTERVLGSSHFCEGNAASLLHLFHKLHALVPWGPGLLQLQAYTHTHYTHAPHLCTCPNVPYG